MFRFQRHFDVDLKIWLLALRRYTASFCFKRWQAVDIKLFVYFLRTFDNFYSHTTTFWRSKFFQYEMATDYHSSKHEKGRLSRAEVCQCACSRSLNKRKRLAQNWLHKLRIATRRQETRLSPDDKGSRKTDNIQKVKIEREIWSVTNAKFRTPTFVTVLLGDW